MNEKIGVVTVLYNSDDVLPDFFLSLSLQTNISYKLYVVDNSPSDSGSILARKFSEQYGIETVVIFNNKNVGVATGNNQGIIAALNDHCKYVLLLNNDVVFPANLFSILLVRMHETSVDMVAPKMYYFEPDNKLWFAGGDFDASRLYSASHQFYNEIDVGQANAEKIISYAPTCCLLVKASVFDKIGLMRDEYFVYWDDTDFCFRAMQANLKMLYAPKAHLFHKVSSLTGAESPFSTRFMTKNRIYFYRVNFGKFTGIIFAFLISIWIILKSVKLIFQPQKRNLTLKSLWEGWMMRKPEANAYKSK